MFNALKDLVCSESMSRQEIRCRPSAGNGIPLGKGI